MYGPFVKKSKAHRQLAALLTSQPASVSKSSFATLYGAQLRATLRLAVASLITSSLLIKNGAINGNVDCQRENRSNSNTEAAL